MIKKETMYLFILQCCGFLLLWEWLRPLKQLTYTGQVHYFVIFIACLLILNGLPLRRMINTMIKILLLFCFLYFMFNLESLSIIQWGIAFTKDTFANINRLFYGQIDDLTDLFRTFLFFILLWIMTYLLQYWLIIRKRIFVFYMMTIIYIAILDTFTKYNGEWAIVRIVAIGFILLGMLFFERLLEKEKMNNQKGLLFKWMLSLIFMLLVSICIGYVAPKAGPIWPDPVPFLQSTADNVLPRKDNISTVGYSSDDSKLGGPFLGDDRVVFEVKTDTRQYWRVENKDFYTGKGWTTSKESDPQGVIQTGEYVPVDITSTPDGPIRSASFTMELLYPHIIMPYGFLSVHGNKDGYFEYDKALNKLNSYGEDDSAVSLDHYTVNYRKTSFSLKAMRATDRLPADPFYEEMIIQYTQLPDALPERVKELAYELTGEFDNWYDKAKAVERYFRRGNFTYSQSDVAIPGKDQDYVDQFLFETKKGYCDNFSTSMVTLLRAADIPARWAKGYSAGSLISEEEGEYHFEVTNNEAHSWVEVFFPTEGWVPFEPTIGFINFATVLQDDVDKNITPAASSTQPEPIEREGKSENIEQEEEKQEVPIKKENKTASTNWNQIQLASVSTWQVVVLIAMFALLIAFLFYLNRRRWIPPFLLWNYKNKTGNAVIINAYDDLLKQLDRLGMKREIGQTLRDYAIAVDQKFATTDMSELTRVYERVIYRDSIDDTNWEHAHELWENLIKRTSG